MQVKKRLLTWGLLALLLLPVSSLWAASLQHQGGGSAWWCGTYDLGIEEALARREWNRRRLNRESVAPSDLRAQAVQAGPRVRQEGNVAVIEDDGTIVANKNLFDYEDKGVQFLRKKKTTYRVKNQPGSVNANLGDKLTITDDDSVKIDLPGFKVKFFGKKYSSLYVNSDGNITFGEAEHASTARDMQRMLNGPPRIAAFFNDLNPEVATGDGGIYARIAGNKLIVTWWEVPEFDTQNSNSFQLILTAKGKIEVQFGSMDAKPGIVGIAPGGGSGLELVDLTEDLPIKRKKVAIAERFTESETLDETAVATVFYDWFADDYDQLVMFKDFGRLASQDAFAYHLTIQNKVKGIGYQTYDGSNFFGSKGRLGGFVNMGGVSQYSGNIKSVAFFRLYSGLDILAHELGHQWLVRATFIASNGTESVNLLGRGDAHWSFHFDSDLSFLEGNEIVDNGDGTFSTKAPRASYNPLDLYLMGLIAAKNVPDMFYVSDPSNSDLAETSPAQPNLTFRGTRVDVTMDQILAAMGKRKPAVADAPKDFKVAFILLAKKGTKAKGASINTVEKFASQIPELFTDSTRGKATIDMTLVAK